MDDDSDDETCRAWLEGEGGCVEDNKPRCSNPTNLVEAFGFLDKNGEKEKKVLPSSKAAILGSGNALIVNPCQKGNPILELIHGVTWRYADGDANLAVDYIMGPSTCCLFLSLRYHALKPEYIYERLKLLRRGGMFALRILLCLVDVKDSTHSVQELTKLCLVSDVTLLLAFSNEEAATYLQTFKSYEHKPADSLKTRQSDNRASRSIEVLASVRAINSTDAHTLLTNFGSLSDVGGATEEELGLCPGIGGTKVRSLHRLFRQSFLK
nr:DNA excision repair protein ERCC-1 [Ciona intestinalis]|eukprot:XP_026694956.1 DNA excision repair protein ERCC-1 [Ciona intestinalis]